VCPPGSLEETPGSTAPVGDRDRRREVLTVRTQAVAAVARAGKRPSEPGRALLVTAAASRREVEQVRQSLEERDELLTELGEAQSRAERIGGRLARTLESITDAFYTLDREWRFTYVNHEAERIQQRTRAELLGRSVWDVFPEAVGTVFDLQFHHAMASGETVTFEAFYPPLDLWAAVRAFPSEDGLGVFFLDVSAAKKAEAALLASERRYRALFERSGDAILIADDSGRYVDANIAAAVLLGLPCAEIIGHRLNDFLAEPTSEEQQEAAWQAFRAAGELHGQVRVRRPNGEIRDTEFNAVADTSPGLHFGEFRDVTERQRQERSSAQRRRLLAALRRLPQGDEPEHAANAICVELVANGDFPSAAIYPFGTEDETTALGARLHDGRGIGALPPLSKGRLAALEVKAHGGAWVEDISGPDDGSPRARIAQLGIRALALAPIESEGQLVALLVAGADETAAELAQRLPALVEFAALASSLLGPGLRQRSQRTIERNRIRQIIATSAFRPVFQPIVEMTTSAVLGYEALTRFSNGTPPDEVFQAAADAGLGLELEAVTIEVALDAAAPLRADCFLDINVSPDLVMARKPLQGLLRRSAPGVVLEITEHVDVQNYVTLREALASMGGEVRFAVDDAGAGFASPRHILELAPSHVKLDRALVARIDTDPARQALVAGLVHFATEIEVMLIAEGVETEAERQVLLRLGVHVGQGYLLGRPAPAADLAGKAGQAFPTRGNARQRTTARS
jgi:PAS domain S-box-containing protein